MKWNYHQLYGYLTIGRSYGDEKHVVVPETLDGMPVLRMEETFRENYAVESVEFPSGIHEIGEALFSDCQNLRSFLIPDGFTAVLDRGFCTCRHLEHVVLPASLTSVGRLAFYGCESLPRIDLSSVQHIGAGAFYLCRNLTHVTLGEGLRSIPDASFGCTASLRSIVIPDSVETIGAYAFEDSAVSEIYVPDRLLGTLQLQKCKAVLLPKHVLKVQVDRT